MSKVYLLRIGSIDSKQLDIGIISKKDVAEKWETQEIFNNYKTFELDDPKLLNRIAKEGRGNVIEPIENKTANPYKGPINIPCSACSAGDTKMEYHNHGWVPELDRRHIESKEEN